MIRVSWAWWCMPLILALERQRQVDLSEFKASLVYIMSFRKLRAIQRDPVSKNKSNKWTIWKSKQMNGIPSAISYLPTHEFCRESYFQIVLSLGMQQENCIYWWTRFSS